MSGESVMWVHGTIVQPQTADASISIERVGWGTILRTARQRVWFHFPVATPVILEGARLGVSKVYVLYKTVGQVMLASLHVWDGGNRIVAFDNLRLSGDHSTSVDFSNSWFLGQPVSLASGLTISPEFQFGAPSGATLPEVTLFSAGAEFMSL